MAIACIFGGWIVFGLGFFSFCSRWKHLLTVMLSLEMMMLGVFLVVVWVGVEYLGSGWFVLIFLGFVVCESGYGLGLIVSLVRGHGSDCLMGFVGDVGYNY